MITVTASFHTATETSKRNCFVIVMSSPELRVASRVYRHANQLLRRKKDNMLSALKYNVALLRK